MRRFAEANEEMHRVVEMTQGEAKGSVMIWKFYDVAIPFFADGSTEKAKAWIAQLKANHPDDPMASTIRRYWARAIGDFAEAVLLDTQQPYYDADGTPHWQQDLDAAFDFVGTGDMATARSRLEKLLPQLKADLEKEPGNSGLWSAYGRAEAVLGDRAEALAAAKKVVELVPESNDAVEGPGRSAIRAKILAWTGDKEQALAEFSRLLHVPYGTDTYGDRFDPGWGPLRDDPRFQALLADPKNNEPIN
jgi:tetratricopeptide (TPR) repeat protein